MVNAMIKRHRERHISHCVGRQEKAFPTRSRMCRHSHSTQRFTNWMRLGHASGRAVAVPVGGEPPLRRVYRSNGGELPGRTPHSMCDFQCFEEHLGWCGTKVCVYIFQCEIQLLSPSTSHFPVQKEMSGSKITAESASQVQSLWMTEPYQGILIECPFGHPCEMLATI